MGRTEFRPVLIAPDAVAAGICTGGTAAGRVARPEALRGVTRDLEKEVATRGVTDCVGAAFPPPEAATTAPSSIGGGGAAPPPYINLSREGLRSFRLVVDSETGVLDVTWPLQLAVSSRDRHNPPTSLSIRCCCTGLSPLCSGSTVRLKSTYGARNTAVPFGASSARRLEASSRLRSARAIRNVEGTAAGSAILLLRKKSGRQQKPAQLSTVGACARLSKRSSVKTKKCDVKRVIVLCVIVSLTGGPRRRSVAKQQV